MHMPTNSSLALRSGQGEEYEPPSRIARSLVVKRVNLALQGGGAHGAFTWGVLGARPSNSDDERMMHSTGKNCWIAPA